MTKAYDCPDKPIVIPAAFSPREGGEGIQRLLDERHWVPAFAGTT
jgi:hypothetical protein